MSDVWTLNDCTDVFEKFTYAEPVHNKRNDFYKFNKSTQTDYNQPIGSRERINSQYSVVEVDGHCEV